MTPRLPGRSLRGKLFAAVLLSSVVALVLTCASLFAYNLHAYRAGASADLQVQSRLLGSNTAAALQFDDPASAAQNLSFLRARPTIRAAAIYAANGSLFARYLRAGRAASEIPPGPGSSGVTISGDRIRSFDPIVADDGSRIGTVFLEADLEMSRQIWSYLAIAMAVMVSALGIALLLSAWLQGGITRPLVEMAGLAREVVERRDYTLRARAQTGDEVGTLAKAFNGMLAEIEDRTTALEVSAEEIGRLNKDLERRVADRTAQLEETNRQLELAAAAKSNFLSTMSHEIRTPMNGVLGMLELLSLSELDGPQRTTLEVVRESARSLLRIIDDILDFSKIEAGKLEIRREVASLEKVVEAVRGIYAANASSKGLVLRSTFDARISPAVVVDPLRLQQILNNLVSNAIKFTERGQIEIRALLLERRGGEDVVRFSIADTGIGISPEEQAQLFQPFVQAVTARAMGGTGLGLSICRRLAQLMGGSVDIESAPGRGTTISLTLAVPIAAPEALPGPAGDAAATIRAAVVPPLAVPTPERAAAEGRLVLVVDDHPVNRMVLSRQVSALGYAHEAAGDGAEALAKWRSGRFTLIITDCNMPVMDGYALARAIREEERHAAGRRTVIIACTANALRGEAENCFAAGMDDYIAKPVELTRLHGKLANWLPLEAEARTDEDATPLASSPPLAAGPLFDAEVLDEITAGDAALRRDVIARFQDADADDATRLFDAIDGHDVDVVARAAHRISGSARAIGAIAYSSVAQRIERAAKAGDWPAIAGARRTLESERERLAAYLARAGTSERA